MNSAPHTHRSGNLTWFKSSYSGSEGGNCIEVATGAGTIHVRDSKNPDGPTLTLTPTTWAAFIDLTRQMS